MTFREASGKYIASLSGARSENTVIAYKTAVARFGSFVDPETSLERISRETIVSFRTHLLTSGVKKNSARDYIRKLGVVFNWCVDMGYMSACPVNSADVPAEGAREYNLLTEDEIERLLKAVTVSDGVERVAAGSWRENTARNRAMIAVLLCCGLRNSELRMLCIGDLNFKDGYILVRHGKGDKRRSAPFPKPAQEAVVAYLQSGYIPKEQIGDPAAILFGSKGDPRQRTDGAAALWKPFSVVGVEGVVNAYLSAIIGRTVKAHAMRHAAASYWDRLGVGMRDVQNALGHASINTTERVYVRILNRGRAASAVNAAFSKN